MKILNCPLNGPRNIVEFSYGGELHHMPDPSRSDPRAWAEYVFFHDNSAGIVIEWWYHNATAYWFLAERNTITDEIIRTFPASDVFREPVDLSGEKDAEYE
jgi:sarcosine oxidase subunit delta